MAGSVAAPAKGTKEPPPLTPAELAAAAIATLNLPSPKAGSAPRTARTAWARSVSRFVDPALDPQDRHRHDPRVAITATAKVTWSISDGDTVACRSAGTRTVMIGEYQVLTQ